MNNLLSYCGLVDARIRASNKDLPVQPQVTSSVQAIHNVQAAQDLQIVQDNQNVQDVPNLQDVPNVQPSVIPQHISVETSTDESWLTRQHIKRKRQIPDDSGGPPKQRKVRFQSRFEFDIWHSI